MKVVFGMLVFVCMGSANAQGIPVTANDYTSEERQAQIVDSNELARERSELKSINAAIAVLPANTQASPDLALRRRSVIHKLELREYHFDEADRRLIKHLTAELKKTPDHPWAADWKTKIADAQKHLLREPSDLWNPGN